jgi:hypothetical protein
MTATGIPSRTPGQVIGAAATGLVIGLAGGTALGAGLTEVSTGGVAIGGAAVMSVVSGWADATRTPGRPQPLWVRILASVFLAAAIGWLLERVLAPLSFIVVGAATGVAIATLGLRIRKVLIGAVVGLAVGAVFASFAPGVGWGVVVAATVATYRSLAGILYRGRDQIRFVAEQVEAGEVPFVVPLAEQQGYVGVDYLQRHAEATGAIFTRNPPDIGIVESLDQLAGPGFDPDAVHPLLREFYEHTSRFALAITPKWRWWMRLPYLVYREILARPLGQANAPFRLEEVARGVVSWIDTIDVDDDGIADFRAWIRAYEDSLEPLFVGIYTTVRHENTGYVSVGFPLPSGSFTATLVPTTFRGDGLLLSSRRGEFQGHYLSVVDPDRGGITVAKLESFAEEIEVYVVDEELRTDHRFFIGGVEFMSLHYEITRR